jgi:opacity protein-like surface antigen
MSAEVPQSLSGDDSMKQWKSVITIVAVLTAFGAANASAQIGFLVGGGLTVPTGDLADEEFFNANTGFNAIAGVDITMPASPVDFRLEAGFTQFGIADFDANWRVLSGGAAAVLNIPMVAASPYLIGGAGIYNQKATGDDIDDNESETDLGINVGAGVGIPLMGIRGLFGEVRFHNIFSKDDETGMPSVNFISFTIGLKL